MHFSLSRNILEILGKWIKSNQPECVQWHVRDRKSYKALSKCKTFIVNKQIQKISLSIIRYAFLLCYNLRMVSLCNENDVRQWWLGNRLCLSLLTSTFLSSYFLSFFVLLIVLFSGRLHPMQRKATKLNEGEYYLNLFPWRLNAFYVTLPFDSLKAIVVQ